ncbi:MAG: hypothetical protein MJ252_11310 [archaeon]|nr:hypothetical protein [archaeon]
MFDEIEERKEDYSSIETEFISNQIEEPSNAKSFNEVPFLNPIWNGKNETEKGSLKKHKTMEIIIPQDEENNDLVYYDYGSQTVKNLTRRNSNTYEIPLNQIKPKTSKLNIPAANLYNSFQYYNYGYLTNHFNPNIPFNYSFGFNNLQQAPIPINYYQTPNQTNFGGYNNLFSNGSSPQGYNLIQNYSMNIPNQNKSSSLNEINQTVIEDILIGKEKRTSLMLNKIPDKYNKQQLLSEIDSLLKIKGTEDRIYDYFYLPMSETKKQKNLGYAFINLVHPIYVIHFYYLFRNYKWTKYNSNKEFNIKFADKQGKIELIQQLTQKYGNEKIPDVFETVKEIFDFENNKKIKIKISSKLKDTVENKMPNLKHIFEYLEE